MTGRLVIQAGEFWLMEGDFRDHLGQLDGVDHVITDPPYSAAMQARHAATTVKRNDGGAGRKALGFDHVEDLRGPLLDWAADHVRGWLLAFCDSDGVADWHRAVDARAIKWKLAQIWDKPDAMPKMNGQSPALAYEMIATAWCGPGHSRWNGGGKRGVFRHPTNGPDREGSHPTEKPLGLMMELVALFTQPGDLVVDPCMGSGTTGVACRRLGRRFIGIEQNPEWFELSRRRIADATRQPDFLIQARKPRPSDQMGLALPQSGQPATAGRAVSAEPGAPRERAIKPSAGGAARRLSAEQTEGA